MIHPAFRNFILSFGFFLCSVTSTAQWIQSGGPYSGNITKISSSGSILLAGTSDLGIFISTDNGTHWNAKNTGILPRYIRSNAVDGLYLFLGLNFNGGVYVSSDNGDHWTITGLKYTTAQELLVVDSGLYAGTSDKGIQRSTDHGVTWTALNNGLTDLNVTSLAVFNDIFFAGTYSGVFRSTDHGANWSSFSNGLINLGINSFAFADTDLFVSTGSGIFRSTLNGIAWTNVNNGLTYPWAFPIASYVDGTGNHSVITGTFGYGIYISTDRGNSWNPADSGLGNYIVKHVHVAGSTLYAGTLDGVFRSNNFARSWEKIGLPSSYVSCFGKTANTLFAGTSVGMYKRSKDGNSVWSESNEGITDSYITTLLTVGTVMYSGSGDGVCRSTDEGVSWEPRNSGLTEPHIASLAVLDTMLFAATDGYSLFRSTNGGGAWSPLSKNFSTNHLTLLAPFGSTLFGAQQTAVIRSTNIGETWTSIPLGGDVRAFASSDPYLFAGIYGGGVFRSTDNGNSWKSFNTGLEYMFVNSLLVEGNFLLAGTSYGGIMKTKVTADQWVPVKDNIIDLDIRALTVFASDVFVGTWGGGVWKFPVSNITEVLSNQDEIPHSFSLHQNFPNPFNPSTTIRFDVPKAGTVAIGVYNAVGQCVRTLVDGFAETGTHDIRWDGKNDRGITVSTGIYYCRMRADGLLLTTKLMLMK